jgi:dicarboxylate carrier protein MatC
VIHVVGVVGLVVVFLIGTWRSINLGALGLIMTFLVGTIVVGESARDLYAGFPVDLFVLLTGVTYLFALAANNGTIDRIVERGAQIARGRRALIPWVIFIVASLPTMAGAPAPAGVALLAPLSFRLAERFDIDRRLIGLVVVHGTAASNFSPLNPLGALVNQTMARQGVSFSAAALFLVNYAYNIGLALVILWLFRRGARHERPTEAPPVDEQPARFSIEQRGTLLALVALAVTALAFNVNIGFLAFAAAVVLQLLFPKSAGRPDQRVAWSVVLLVCGIVTYVAALQRYGTVDAAGTAIAALNAPLLTALLLCAIGATTSAFAASPGILGAMIPLALPFVAVGAINATALIIALSISVTVVDGMPFSAVGALIVANAAEAERPRVYRGLLWWGAAMVVTAPLVTWLLLILPTS